MLVMWVIHLCFNISIWLGITKSFGFLVEESVCNRHCAYDVMLEASAYQLTTYINLHQQMKTVDVYRFDKHLKSTSCLHCASLLCRQK